MFYRFLRIPYTNLHCPLSFLRCNFSRVITPPPMTSFIIVVVLHKHRCVVDSLQILISTNSNVCVCVRHRVSGRKDQHTGAKVTQFGSASGRAESQLLEHIPAWPGQATQMGYRLTQPTTVPWHCIKCLLKTRARVPIYSMFKCSILLRHTLQKT